MWTVISDHSSQEDIEFECCSDPFLKIMAQENHSSQLWLDA